MAQRPSRAPMAACELHGNNFIELAGAKWIGCSGRFFATWFPPMVAARWGELTEGVLGRWGWPELGVQQQPACPELWRRQRWVPRVEGSRSRLKQVRRNVLKPDAWSSRFEMPSSGGAAIGSMALFIGLWFPWRARQGVHLVVVLESSDKSKSTEYLVTTRVSFGFDWG
jgi:hypothetical protein